MRNYELSYHVCHEQQVIIIYQYKKKRSYHAPLILMAEDNICILYKNIYLNKYNNYS